MDDAAPKRPNPVDVHVGGRVRLRRMLLGMSQERLGEQMNLTFQQVQKYEKGANRIGASRLHQIAGILGVPVAYFFEELTYQSTAVGQPGFAEDGRDGSVMDFLNSREGMELNRAFMRIQSPKLRRSIIEHVRAIADRESEDQG
ncbi:MAG: helix-turn-helix domain-containing protein [Rhizobiales bacterium]|nr:helix-turn-helix domain-containing protein [Hyphomicrobiales bacterium]